RYRPVRVPGLPPLVAGAIGYFAYDIVRLFERIPDRSQNDLGTDDAVMMFYLGLVVFDHVRHRVWVVRNVFTEGPGSLRSKYRATVREISETRRLFELPLDHNRRKPNRPATRLRVQSNFTRSRYLAAVRKSKEYVRAGDVFQVVISQRFSARTLADPFDIYRALRVLNPSPYMYFLKLGDTAIVGSSPELLLKVQGRDAYYRPIAGTRPRGKDENEDQRLAAELAADPKERAMEILDELEPPRRGTYAGAILYLDFSGNLDSCIAIRTMVVKRGLACVQAGAGLVADSVPEREYQETVNKARALIAALEVA